MKQKRLETKDLIVKKARNGLGIFAKKDFKVGKKVFEIKGSRITGDVDEDIDDTTRSNAYRFDKNFYISPDGRMGDFLNHSCKPNVKITKEKGKLFVMTISDIKKAKEFVFDYSTIVASDDIWEMKCNCGEKDCRRVIRGFKSLPKKIKEFYISEKIVPKHILNI
jgi:SET domain-containing protein